MPPRARSRKMLAKIPRCPQRHHFSRLVSLLVEVRDYVHEKIRTPQDSGACEHPYATYRRWIEANAHDEFLSSRNFAPHISSLTKKNYYSAYMFGMLVKPFTDAGHSRNPHLFDIRPWQIFGYYRFSQSIINVELIRFSLMVNRDGPRYKPSISLPENTVTSFEVVIYLLYIGQIMFPRRPDADSTHRGARKVIFPSFRINSRHINRFTTAVTTVIRSWDNFAQSCKFQSIEALTAPYINFNTSVYLFRPLQPSDGFASLHQANSLLNNPPSTTSPTAENSYPASASLDPLVDQKLRAITARFLSDLAHYLLDDQLFATRNLQSSPVNAFLQPSKTFDSLPRRFDDIADQVSELQSMAKEDRFEKAFGSIRNIPNFQSLPSNFNNEHVVYVTKPPKRHRGALPSPREQSHTSGQSSFEIDHEYEDVPTSEHSEEYDVSNVREEATFTSKSESLEHSPIHPSSPKRLLGSPRLHASFTKRLTENKISDLEDNDMQGNNGSRSESTSDSEGNDASDSDYSGSSWPRPRVEGSPNAGSRKFSRSTRLTHPRPKRNAQRVIENTSNSSGVRLGRRKINHRVPHQNKTSLQQLGNENIRGRKRQREQDSEADRDDQVDNKLRNPADVGNTGLKTKEFAVQDSEMKLGEMREVQEETKDGDIGLKEHKGGEKTEVQRHISQDDSQACFKDPDDSEHDNGDYGVLVGKTEDLRNENTVDDQVTDGGVTKSERESKEKLTPGNQETPGMMIKREPSMTRRIEGARLQTEVEEASPSEQIMHLPKTKTSPVVVLSDDGDETRITAIKREKQEISCIGTEDANMNSSERKTNRKENEKLKIKRRLKLLTDVSCSSFPVISTLPVCIMNGLGVSWGRSRDMRDLYDYPTQMWPANLIKAIDGAEECLMRMAELTHRNVYVDSSKMEADRTGVFALEEFAEGEVICEFFGTLVYECEHELRDEGPEMVTLRMGQLEKNLRVTEEKFNATGVALPQLNGEWKLRDNTVVQRVYVVPCKTSVAATIVNTLILGNESEERMFVKERGTNAALTWKRGTQGIDKKAHMCETAAMGIIAVRHIRADEEICAAYETGLDSATKMFFSPARRRAAASAPADESAA